MDYNAGQSLTESVTACQAALTTLQRLGHTADADTPLTQAASSTPYAALDSDRDHTDAWKQQRYAQAYINVMSTLARQLTAAANKASTGFKDDAERVYGTKGLQGDPGFLIVSLRDAQDRIEGEYDSVKLQRLLDKAVLNGDEVRAHAIVENAVEAGDQETVEAFQAAYPALAEATARLWNAATHRQTTADIATAWRLAALKPGALAGLQDYEIASLAAGR